MSREIKFRAWHKLKKRWFTGREIIGYINIISNDDKYIAGNFLQIPNLSTYDFVFVQFTGLTDKNGKEIYEGDVLGYVDDSLKLGVVKYESHGFVIDWDEDCHMSKHILNLSDRFDVIGNVYDNPELLEK